jgi:hypothetical protein
MKQRNRGKDCFKCPNCLPGPFCRKQNRRCTTEEISEPTGIKECQKNNNRSNLAVQSRSEVMSGAASG